MEPRRRISICSPRLWRLAIVGVVVAATASVGSLTGSGAHEGHQPAPTEEAAPAPSPAIREGDRLTRPDTFTSHRGRLHLRVVARTGPGVINGVRYTKMRRFHQRVVGGHGHFREGTGTGYISPTWRVQPGDTLVIDLVNDLDDMYFEPVHGTPEEIPQPLNLHTHGLSVDPSGNSDNVLLSIPPGRSNRYVIRIPEDQDQGLYWYHPHLHGITDDQVYLGMAGMIIVGRSDGNYRQLDGLTRREIALRYNIVPPGQDGRLQNASPYRSDATANPPRGDMIYTANGINHARVRLDSAVPARGRAAETQVWSLINITGSATYVLALDEVDAADADDPTVVGRPRPLRIVSVDGTPMRRPIVLRGRAARDGYLIPQGGRAAILVDGASGPGKVVRLLTRENASGTGMSSAYDWPRQRPMAGFRDYTQDIFATTYSGRRSAEPRPHRDTPARLTTRGASHLRDVARAPVSRGRTFTFDEVMTPTPDTPNNFPIDGLVFPEGRVAQPRAGTAERWRIENHSSLHHPFHLHTQYARVQRITSPRNPDYRPPVGQLPTVQDVTDLSRPRPARHTQDVTSLPPALIDDDGDTALRPDGTPVRPAVITAKVLFRDYLGTYVEHCHRLPHEDRGMMTLVRTIPHTPVWVRVSPRGVVRVVRSRDGAVLATIHSFVGTRPSVAVGDVDDDALPDVAVATGPGVPGRVAVFSGDSRWRRSIQQWAPFGGRRTGLNVAVGDLSADSHDDVIVGQRRGPSRVAVHSGADGGRIAGLRPYGRSFRGGVSVAADMIADGGRVSLVTGSGPGRPARVRVFNPDLLGDGRGRRFPDPDDLRLVAAGGWRVAGARDGGIRVATGSPFARLGGFASVVAAPMTRGRALSVFSLGNPMGEHEVAATGTHRPFVYRPGARVHALLVSRLRVPGPRRGLVAAMVSTTSAAKVLVGSPSGGPVRFYTADGDRLVPHGRLRARAVGLAGF